MTCVWLYSFVSVYIWSDLSDQSIWFSNISQSVGIPSFKHARDVQEKRMWASCQRQHRIAMAALLQNRVEWRFTARKVQHKITLEMLQYARLKILPKKSRWKMVSLCCHVAGIFFLPYIHFQHQPRSQETLAWNNLCSNSVRKSNVG